MFERDYFMMFPENYTWSGAVLTAIASSMWGGSEMGEIYKVCASLKKKYLPGRKAARNIAQETTIPSVRPILAIGWPTAG